MARQMGITTHQIKTAPTNATYLWCSNDLSYPKAIAYQLNRTDLIFVGPSWFTHYKWRGYLIRSLVVDHAVKLTPSETEMLYEIRARLILTENCKITH
jgi:hypothetical protein